ncbi:peptidase S1 and S6, chymotrypsin/Hap [Stanieria sp. NIES-3757]|nr:peptidase S1 and S6, chymotrypsin/Hap [Stanieria sp. NIES-3757]
MITSFLGGLLSFFHSQSIPKVEHRPNHTDNLQLQLISNRLFQEQSVEEIAKQVTVRILTDSGLGSGAIIARQGQTYTILTNHHVVTSSLNQAYTVLTDDGQRHQAQWLQSSQFGTLDVALLQFTSNNSYRVVKIGDSKQLSVGNLIYASGFPAWHFTREGNKITALEDTRHWGLRAFRFTKGRVGMLPEQALSGGYQIGYSNDVVEGMSGGPVFNEQAELIGINGMLKYPLQDTQAIVFVDGTAPSEQLFQQMETLSWAIPINEIHYQIETLNGESAVIENELLRE